MAVNPEYIRLNRYKRPEYHWIVEVPEKSVPKELPFAYDLSANPVSNGEVRDYKAINASITMILLSAKGEHIFRPWLGSVAQTTPFERFASATNISDFAAQIASDIESVERRIKVLDVKCSVSEDNHSITVSVPYMVLDNGKVGVYSNAFVAE